MVWLCYLQAIVYLKKVDEIQNFFIRSKKMNNNNKIFRANYLKIHFSLSIYKSKNKIFILVKLVTKMSLKIKENKLLILLIKKCQNKLLNIIVISRINNSNFYLMIYMILMFSKYLILVFKNKDWLLQNYLMMKHMA